MNVMQMGAMSATGTKIDMVRSAIIGTPDASLGQRLAHEIQRCMPPSAVTVVSRLAQMRERHNETGPRAILLDDSILEGAPLVESLRQLTEIAPVILLAGPERHADITRLVAEGDVEFVARAGNFVPLAAALIERRLRWAERSETALGPPWAGLPADSAEIFRHEINNPLTGILGNAELLLAHRDRLPAAETQRLETVVDLAVRLRETIRRLSNAWETQPPSLKSA